MLLKIVYAIIFQYLHFVVFNRLISTEIVDVVLNEKTVFLLETSRVEFAVQTQYKGACVFGA